MPRRSSSSASTTTGTGVASMASQAQPPPFQAVPAQELAKYFGRGNAISEQLRQLAPGEGGLINVGNGDVRVIKRQYTLAAKPFGWTLAWGEVNGSMLPFMVQKGSPIGTTTNGNGRTQSTGNTVRLNRGRATATADT